MKHGRPFSKFKSAAASGDDARPAIAPVAGVAPDAGDGFACGDPAGNGEMSQSMPIEAGRCRWLRFGIVSMFFGQGIKEREEFPLHHIIVTAVPPAFAREHKVLRLFSGSA